MSRNNYHGGNFNRQNRQYRGNPYQNRRRGYTRDFSDAQTSIDENQYQSGNYRPRPRYDSRSRHSQNNDIRTQPYIQQQEVFLKNNQNLQLLERSQSALQQSQESTVSLQSNKNYRNNEEKFKNNVSGQPNQEMSLCSGTQNILDQSILNQDQQELVQDIMLQIQSFNYEIQTFDQLKTKFFKACQNHLIFKWNFMKPKDSVGKQLVSNGFVHELWSKIALKNTHIQKNKFLQEYYNKYRTSILKGLDSFQKTFNPIPDEDEVFDHQNMFKRYRQKYDSNSTSVTRMDCMIIFQQVKSEMKSADLQEMFGKHVGKTVEEWRVKTAEQELSLNAGVQDEFYRNNAQDQTEEDDESQSSKKAQLIKKVKDQHDRERSPTTKRFRMIRECQSNQRRLFLETACVFFNIDHYYHLNDLQIVSIEETVFSQKQELIILKAYTVDFSAEINKMKIQPKLKRLIAAYKFSGLQELTRLQRTHGVFDGMFVYPESFNIKKYLSSNQCLSLLKDEFIKQVKEQLPSPADQQQY